ncbi:RabGAP/TBC domain-containing protein [Quillaja saponaria]|uniref:TBC1 domain family member 15 n=1 Tax=Quillaja saponaria TaxID=32244 RepID=A0AAD7PJ77_QUISA|nr:RabGAP/TBC domain-containing protein [Quillaja saponaria]
MMMCSDNSTQSSSSEPEGAAAVFVKDNVAIHPTQFASERISGRLKLTKLGSSLFMTWIPYKGQSSNARLSEKDRNLYAIRAVPISDVRSIRRHSPALGWQYIIVVLYQSQRLLESNSMLPEGRENYLAMIERRACAAISYIDKEGLAFPPLYFYSGGVKKFLATVKQHVFLVRSAEDANVYLVNDSQNPLQRTFSSLELPRVVSVASGPSTLSVGESTLNESQAMANVGVRDENSSSSLYKERQRQRVHDPARDLSIQESIVADEIPDGSDVASDPLEFKKLSLVWGKPRQPPLGTEKWLSFLDSERRVMDSLALRKRIFYGRLEHTLRKQVWGFLLGYHSYDSTYAEREYLKSVKKSEYETIKNQWQSISQEQAKRFTKFRERKGLIDKDVVKTDRSLDFYDGEDNPNVNALRDILMMYSFYNFDIGYCQGMSDLLSPILFVMHDESVSFWCFVALMERLGPNFNRDQSGMQSQLFSISKLVELLDSPLYNHLKQHECLNYFFCFRWVLIQFKREFEYEKTMQLWEVLWTHYLSEHLHLYACVAILKRYRHKIMGEQMDFDTLLKFLNELNGHIDLDAILRDGEALCICAGENGATCIPPGTRPRCLLRVVYYTLNKMMKYCKSTEPAVVYVTPPRLRSLWAPDNVFWYCQGCPLSR